MRLCAKLSGLMVSIKSTTEAEEERLLRAAQQHAVAAEAAEAAAEQEAPPIEDAAEQTAELVLGIAPVMEPDSGLSIEEQLAEAALKAEEAAEVKAAVEPAAEAVADLSQLPDTVWTAPQVAQPSPRIRFAEDIMAPRADIAPEGEVRRRVRGRQTRGGTGEPAPRVARRSRRDYPLDDDEPDEDDGLDNLDNLDDDLDDLVD